MQTRYLNAVLSFDRIGRLIDAETVNDEYYSALEMMQGLSNGIWKETGKRSNVDLYRRNLQRSYIDRIGYLMTNEPSRSRYSRPGFEGTLYYDVETSDVRALVRGELKAIKSRLTSAKNGRINKETKYHYEDIIARINAIFKID